MNFVHRISLVACLSFTIGTANAQTADRGLRTYQVRSPHQAGKTRLRVLVPDNFDLHSKYRVLYVLPVHEDGVEEQVIDRHGDGLIEIKKHGFQNQHQLICVAPGFTSQPWYADHDLNP